MISEQKLREFTYKNKRCVVPDLKPASFARAVYHSAFFPVTLKITRDILKSENGHGLLFVPRVSFREIVTGIKNLSRAFFSKFVTGYQKNVTG